MVQRAESLVGLFYFRTLYCFIRGATSRRGRLWYAVAVLACLLGMGSKEVMVSAPLMVLLYDRAFLSGSFAAAWRRRCGVYLALAGTWLLLAGLMAAAGDRGGVRSSENERSCGCIAVPSGAGVTRLAATIPVALTRIAAPSRSPSRTCDAASPVASGVRRSFTSPPCIKITLGQLQPSAAALFAPYSLNCLKVIQIAVALFCDRG